MLAEPGADDFWLPEPLPSQESSTGAEVVAAGAGAELRIPGGTKSCARELRRLAMELMSATRTRSFSPEFGPLGAGFTNACAGAACAARKSGASSGALGSTNKDSLDARRL